jgi:D-arabinose 1-dehydrogenase-like Zn-dependent alcohol dehydrogenase
MAAIEIGKAMGARVIATAGSAAKRTFALAAGCRCRYSTTPTSAGSTAFWPRPTDAAPTSFTILRRRRRVRISQPGASRRKGRLLVIGFGQRSRSDALRRTASC